MYISSASVNYGLIAGIGNYLDSNDFTSGLITNIGNFNDLFIVNAVTTQSIANYYFISPHFSPDVFSFVFGENATQNIDSLIIHKSDLTGLTPRTDNTAESLLVGIFNRMLLKNTVNFLKFSVNYWGYGFTENKKITTLLISLFNPLAIENGYEYFGFEQPVNPMDY